METGFCVFMCKCVGNGNWMVKNVTKVVCDVKECKINCKSDEKSVLCLDL